MLTSVQLKLIYECAGKPTRAPPLRLPEISPILPSKQVPVLVSVPLAQFCSFQIRSSSASSFCASLLQAIVGLVWFGLVWSGLVWSGLVWFGLVWFGLVWLNLSNPELSPKRFWRGPRSQEVGEEGDYIPNATLSPLE